MRLLLTALLAALLVAPGCATDPAEPPSHTAEADAPAAGASFTIATDSLVLAVDSIRYAVAIGYPQLRGSTGEPMSATLRGVNASIRDSVQALANAFRPETPPPGQRPEYPVQVDGGPTRSFVSDEVLSVMVVLNAYTGGADRNSVFLPLTYDLRTGQALTPADLFEPGTGWPDTLAEWAEHGVLAQLAARTGGSAEQARADFFAQGLDRIRAGEATVTMGRDSLRLHIPPYQLSSSADDSFDIGVPYPVVGPMARPRSVLARRVQR